MSHVDRAEPVTAAAPPLRGPVIMHQDWRDLAYVHWAVPPERVADLMPAGVRPDTIDGSTYVGLVPFRMVDAAPFRWRPTPWLGTFLETNVRLYSVDSTGRRGVVFLSLDCDRLLVSLAARVGFGVPYRWARMTHRTRGLAGGSTEHVYASTLRRRGPAVSTEITVRVGGLKQPTELDHFVSARWGLHTRRLGRTLYVPNQHEPWPLYDAELVDLRDDVLASVGLGELADRAPDHVAFSPGVHTEFGLPVDARRPRRG